MWLLGYVCWFARVLLSYLGWLLGCCYSVAMAPRVVARWLLWYPRVVAKMLLCGCFGTRGVCQGVAMQLLGHRELFLGVTIQFLWSLGFLPRCCQAVPREQLCGCNGYWGGCYGVAMQLLGYLGWLLTCYARARLLRVVARVLPARFQHKHVINIFLAYQQVTYMQLT